MLKINIENQWFWPLSKVLDSSALQSNHNCSLGGTDAWESGQVRSRTANNYISSFSDIPLIFQAAKAIAGSHGVGYLCGYQHQANFC